MVALQSPAPILADEPISIEATTQYGGSWEVIWLGHRHGGTHTRWLDAAQHAQALREAEDWDYEAWLEMHNYGAGVN